MRLVIRTAGFISTRIVACPERIVQWRVNIFPHGRFKLARLGFLGLGIMGYPMARNLLRAGHDVALWSHTASKAEELAAQGKGIACRTPREVAEKADCIFLCVGDTAMSRQVILG